MNRNIIPAVFSTWLLTGCSSSPKLFVSNVKDLNTLENSSLVYMLPATVINVEVSFRKSTFIPGPYQKYADKYLGIINTGSDTVTFWDISKIKISSAIRPDPGFYFSVTTEGRSGELFSELRRLSESGMIILPGGFTRNDTVISDISLPSGNEVYFKDLSVKRNLDTRNETTYKRVFRDSVYVKVPVKTEALVQKTTEQKAEEAANFIIKLRKRRFKLLTGQNEGDVPDSDIQASIDEMNSIEQEYLSLFTGKSIVETFLKHYNYVPSEDRQTDEQILFRISEREGIFNALSPKGRPVLLEIQSVNLTQPIKKFGNPTEENNICYREPDLAEINIHYEADIISGGRFTIFQYGSVVSKKVQKR